MKTIIKLSIWFVLFIVLLNVGLSMISASNTIENIVGFFIIIAVVIVSIKAKCLTLIKFKKNEK